nr:MAG TPA: hypothetical protein [Inoviridae sp.]
MSNQKKIQKILKKNQKVQSNKIIYIYHFMILTKTAKFMSMLQMWYIYLV